MVVKQFLVEQVSDHCPCERFGAIADKEAAVVRAGIYDQTTSVTAAYSVEARRCLAIARDKVRERVAHEGKQEVRFQECAVSYTLCAVIPNVGLEEVVATLPDYAVCNLAVIAVTHAMVMRAIKEAVPTDHGATPEASSGNPASERASATI